MKRHKKLLKSRDRIYFNKFRHGLAERSYFQLNHALISKILRLGYIFGKKTHIECTYCHSDSILEPIEDHYMDSYDHELESSCNDILKEQGLSE